MVTPEDIDHMAKGRTNLLAFPSNTLDPPSFYRCLGPLAALRQQRADLQVSVVQQVDWASLALADVVMLQRPWSNVQRQIAEMAGRHGIPVWVDHDDDIFQIPKGNPAYQQYMNPGTAANVAAVLRMADVVTCSTGALAEQLSRIRKPTVIPNALMTNIVGTIPAHDGQPRIRMVYWRGSTTHQRDLDRFTADMVSVSEKNPDVPWAFHGIGENNYALLGGIKGSQALKHTDPLDYFHALAKLRPKVVVVPLDDNPFNRSKSNIAWIEATFGGAVCVAPNWPEWQKPGVLTYEPDTFAQTLDFAINMHEIGHAEAWKQSRDYINQNLLVHDVNRHREVAIDACARLRRDDKWRALKRDAFSVKQPPAESAA